ncbi:small acid-soluble spore protein H [Texcoconibacillus texcoconensis]|uniref:Small, acid-soluble spore protein H n=1 Tax=Texcoconibacillus texcoconensis TaxID=1095777 RepID=A0A840QI04_9BACI|nr:small acid-soluble spore protein H [Texcoconibacillus texcoconensis]MBB5171974.1 small acid-soluble spore protein H (minor) [Texcoconibacillus texcoconensis]
MDAQRAQEIVSTQDMINVVYNGDKVFIEHVDESEGKATVHPLDNPEQKQSVSVNDLKEQ